MKFGGTSMGSAERINVAAQICAEQKRQRPVVAVVSAMSKVTDLLLDTLRKAEAGTIRLETNLQFANCEHARLLIQLLLQRLPGGSAIELMAEIEALIGDFRRIAHGVRMLGERPPRSVDEAIAIGERLSALLMADYLNCTGIPAQAVNGAGVDRHGRGVRQRHAADGRDRASAPTKCCGPCSITGSCPWSPASMAPPSMDGPPRSAAGAPTSRHPFWPPRWTPQNSGSGPTWTAS